MHMMIQILLFLWIFKSVQLNLKELNLSYIKMLFLKLQKISELCVQERKVLVNLEKICISKDAHFIELLKVLWLKEEISLKEMEEEEVQLI